MTAALVTATTVVPAPLVSTLVQPEPDPSWGEDGPAEEEAAVEETPDETASSAEESSADTATDVAAPAEPVPTYPVAAPKPTTIDDIKIPEKKGLGLMITAGVLNAASWGVMGWRVSRIKRLCVAGDISLTSVSAEDLDEVTESAADCFVSGRGGNALLWGLQAVPNAVNWGIAPGAATVRAKYDAAMAAKTGEFQRKPNVFIGTGAALLSAGAIGRVVVAVIRIRSLNPTKGIAVGCLNGGETGVDEFFECYADRNALLYGMHQLTSTGIAAGAGLLAYGVVYKRDRANYARNFGAPPIAKLEFSVQPQLSLDYTGVSANLRF